MSTNESDIQDDLEDLSSWFCTCQQLGPSPLDHHQDCQLQQCWDFTEEWVVWDEQSFELVDIFPTIDSDQTPLDQKADLNNAEGALGGDWLDDIWTGHKTAKTSTNLPTYKKCRHYQQAYALPNNVIVYASSHHRDRETDPIPDLGIYMVRRCVDDYVVGQCIGLLIVPALLVCWEVR